MLAPNLKNSLVDLAQVRDRKGVKILTPPKPCFSRSTDMSLTPPTDLRHTVWGGREEGGSKTLWALTPPKPFFMDDQNKHLNYVHWLTSQSLPPAGSHTGLHVK